ncbi:MAG: hypothetical protein KDC55_08625 [Ignavibacteriae bacterium]|nr:hypothetical protein [Ignavibacteriota bacterium]MCB9220394.1 hypothetical protein [Ignavibacteria bacterium]
MKILLFLFFLIHFTTMSQDSTEFINTIEVEMTRCLEVDSNYSTQAMLQCVYSATDSWELELNKNYNELISQLDDDKRTI